MLSPPRNRALQFAVGWIVYAFFSALAFEAASNASDAASGILVGVVSNLVLPYISGGFAADLPTIRIAAYVASALFAATLVVPRLRIASLSRTAFFVVTATSLFAIWVDKYMIFGGAGLTLSKVLAMLVEVFVLGPSMVVDLFATAIWLFAYSAVHRAIGREFAAGPAGGGTIRKPIYYGVAMYIMAMILGIVAQSPIMTLYVLIGVFEQEFGLSQESLAVALGAGRLLGLLPLVFVGSWQDRFGLRRSAIVGLLLLGVACIAATWASSWLSFCIVSFLLQASGLAVALVAANTLPFWYDKRLGMMEGALGLQSVFVTLAVIPNLCGDLVQTANVSWQWMLFLVGGVIWLVVIPVTLLLYRNRPEDVGFLIDGVPAPSTETSAAVKTPTTQSHSFLNILQSRAFWSILIGLCAAYGFKLAAVHAMAPHLLQWLPNQVSVVNLSALFNMFLAIGSVAGGAIADRVAARLVLVTALALCVIGFGSFNELWPILAPLDALCLIGFSVGMYIAASNAAWARYFGRNHLGKVRGIILASATVVGMAAFPLGFQVQGLLGGYGSTCAMIILAVAVATGVAFFARPPLLQAKPPAVVS